MCTWDGEVLETDNYKLTHEGKKRCANCGKDPSKEPAKNTHGGARPNSGPAPTPINMSRLKALSDQGLSRAEIARRLSVSETVIRRAIVRMKKGQTE